MSENDQPEPKIIPNVRNLSADDLGISQDDPGWAATVEEAVGMPPPVPGGIGDTIYAWQMQVEDGWNIIGMQVQAGQLLPLVTTSLPMAWEAFEVAQMHANRGHCQVRLACFQFEALAAVVDPNE